MLPTGLPRFPIYLPQSLLPQLPATAPVPPEEASVKLTQEQIFRRDSLLQQEQTIAPKGLRSKTQAALFPELDLSKIHELFPKISFSAAEILDFVVRQLVASGQMKSHDEAYLVGGAASYLVDPTYPFNDLDFFLRTTTANFHDFRALTLMFIKRKIVHHFGSKQSSDSEINWFLKKYLGDRLECFIDDKTLERMISDIYFSNQFVTPDHTRSLISLGKIDLNFVHKQNSQGVCTADSLHVGVFHPVIRSGRGGRWGTKSELDVAIRHLQQRWMQAHSLPIYRLAFCVIHKMNLGYSIANFPAVVQRSLEKLPAEVPHSKIGTQLQSYIEKHYPNTPQMQLIARINFLFLVSFAPPEVRSKYTQAIARPWVKQLNAEKKPFLARLISPLRNTPELLPEVLSLIQGLFLLSMTEDQRIHLTSDFDQKQAVEVQPHRFAVQKQNRQQFVMVKDPLPKLAFNVMNAFLTLSTRYTSHDWTQLMVESAKELELSRLTLTPIKSVSALAEQLAQLLLRKTTKVGSENPLALFLKDLEEAEASGSIGKKLSNLGIGQTNRLFSLLKKAKLKHSPVDHRYILILYSLLNGVSWTKFHAKLLSSWNLLVKQDLSGNPPEEILILAHQFFEAGAKERDDQTRRVLIKATLPCLLHRPVNTERSLFSVELLEKAQKILETLNVEHPDKIKTAAIQSLIQQLFKRLSHPFERKQILISVLEIALRFDTAFAERLWNIYHQELGEQATSIRAMIQAAKPKVEKTVEEVQIPKIQGLFQQFQDKVKTEEIIKCAHFFPILLENHCKENGPIQPAQLPAIQKGISLCVQKCLSSFETTPAACELIFHHSIAPLLDREQWRRFIRYIIEKYDQVRQIPPISVIAFCNDAVKTLDAASNENLKKLAYAYFKIMPFLVKLKAINGMTADALIQRMGHLKLEQQCELIKHLLTSLAENPESHTLEFTFKLMNYLNQMALLTFNDRHEFYSITLKYMQNLSRHHEINAGNANLVDSLFNRMRTQIEEGLKHLSSTDQERAKDLLLFMKKTYGQIMTSSKSLELSDPSAVWEQVFCSIQQSKENQEGQFFESLEKFLKTAQQGLLSESLQKILISICSAIPKDQPFQGSKIQILKNLELLTHLFKQSMSAKASPFLLEEIFNTIAAKGNLSEKPWKLELGKNHIHLKNLQKSRKSLVLAFKPLVSDLNNKMMGMLSRYQGPIPASWNYSQPLPKEVHELMEQFLAVRGCHLEVNDKNVSKLWYQWVEQILPRYPTAFLDFRIGTGKLVVTGLLLGCNNYPEEEILSFLTQTDEITDFLFLLTPLGQEIDTFTLKTFPEAGIDLLKIYQYLIDASIQLKKIPILDVLDILNQQLTLIYYISIFSNRWKQGSDLFKGKNIDLNIIMKTNVTFLFEVLKAFFSKENPIVEGFLVNSIREMRLTLRSLYLIAQHIHPSYTFPTEIVKFLAKEIPLLVSLLTEATITQLSTYYLQFPGVMDNQKGLLRTLLDKSQKDLEKDPLSRVKMVHSLKKLIESTVKGKAGKPATQESLKNLQAIEKMLEDLDQLREEFSLIIHHLGHLQRFVLNGVKPPLHAFEVKRSEGKEGKSSVKK